MIGFLVSLSGGQIWHYYHREKMKEVALPLSYAPALSSENSNFLHFSGSFIHGLEQIPLLSQNRQHRLPILLAHLNNVQDGPGFSFFLFVML